jgi:hypothetical protein
MAKKPSGNHADKPIEKTIKRALGKPMRQRITKQTPAQQGPMEDQKQDIYRNRSGYGIAVERKRIIFAADLPECECCGEPWCSVCLEHYAACKCVGPRNAEELGYTIIEENGVLWAMKITQAIQ